MQFSWERSPSCAAHRNIAMTTATRHYWVRTTHLTGDSRWSEFYHCDDPRQLAKDFALFMAGKGTAFRPDLIELSIEMTENTVPIKRATITARVAGKRLCNEPTLVFELRKVLNGSRRYQFERDELQPMFNRMLEFLS